MRGGCDWTRRERSESIRREGKEEKRRTCCKNEEENLPKTQSRSEDHSELGEEDQEMKEVSWDLEKRNEVVRVSSIFQPSPYTTEKE